MSLRRQLTYAAVLIAAGVALLAYGLGWLP